MANITNLSEFLSDVANAIRTKKETTEQIPAENFDQEILSIDTIKGQEKTIIPSTAEQIITPDGDYNAITKATVKAVDSTIDSNISPENIKKNINILGVTGTLEEGEQINNQDKEITTNGTYTADEGYTGLGTVTVNVPTSEDLQEQLNAQDTIIKELQAELENKARSKYQIYFDMSLETRVPEMQRFITEIAPNTIDIGEHTSTASMFAYWENLQSIPLFDTSNVISMRETFRSCHSIRTIPPFNTSNVTDMSGMLRNCELLEEIPLLDTSNVTDIGYMFSGCLSLKTVPLLNTSKVKNMQYMFNHCEIIEEIPVLDTTSVTIASAMFGGCLSLKSIPNIDTSHITTAKGMFWDCTSITSIPEFDFRRVIGADNMFNNCNKLVDFPVSRMDMLLHHQDMFLNCTSLSDESLNNILSILANATRITSNKTLAYVGLSEEQAIRCQSLSNYPAFTAAGWTTGY